ncbi:hypothetical protein TNCV_2398161 [Trichonephila clavipes]|uniref:Uncharacterized protein n=1 Tax=Trichonephila clavipes TaxID=2585209 RepID=A0A8X6T2A2_TRICX|nr:hypothetical protein TNCV_2398161 [Trichonephila clavipes]
MSDKCSVVFKLGENASHSIRVISPVYVHVDISRDIVRLGMHVRCLFGPLRSTYDSLTGNRKKEKPGLIGKHPTGPL